MGQNKVGQSIHNRDSRRKRKRKGDWIQKKKPICESRTLEWVAIPFSRDLPDPGIESVSLISPSLAGGFFTISATWETHKITK